MHRDVKGTVADAKGMVAFASRAVHFAKGTFPDAKCTAHLTKGHFHLTKSPVGFDVWTLHFACSTGDLTIRGLLDDKRNIQGSNLGGQLSRG